MTLFLWKTLTTQNGLLIFLGKEIHSETKSSKSSRILTNKATTTTVNPGNRGGFCGESKIHHFVIVHHFSSFVFRFFSSFFFLFHHFSFFILQFVFDNFSFIFFHFLSCSFFFFLFFQFFFFFFFSFSLSGAKILFLGLNFVTISLHISVQKNSFFRPVWGGVCTPLKPLFLFFSPFFLFFFFSLDLVLLFFPFPFFNRHVFLYFLFSSISIRV